MTCNNSLKILAATIGFCLVAFFGAWVSTSQSEKHEAHRARIAFMQRRYADGFKIYASLRDDLRNDPALRERAIAACEELGCGEGPLAPRPRVGEYVVCVFATLVIASVVLVLLRKPKRKPAVEVKYATDSQKEMIRRLSNGSWMYPTSKLTQEAATQVIRQLMNRKMAEKVDEEKRTARVFDPQQFMSQAQLERAWEKERKAKDKAERDKARAEEKERKAEDRQYKKREAEEAKIYAMRDVLREGGPIRKAKDVKARDIQEFQRLVAEILEDNIIEAQEVRRVKAWLVENSKFSLEFARPIRLMDEALQDGVIDEREQSLIYEAFLDCVILLRQRK